MTGLVKPICAFGGSWRRQILSSWADRDDVAAFYVSQGLTADTVVELKNVGAQVPYRWLFLAEYFGPIPIMLWFATRPALVYGDAAAGSALSSVAQWAVWAWVLHYVKRELETLFVHKFSKPSVPVFGFVRNCVYYWGFAALVAYFVCSPSFTGLNPETAQMLFIGMAVAEAMNGYVHLWFAMQRKADKDDARPIPAGFPFFVSCPNYTFEILSWVLFSIACGSHWSAWAFTVVGAGQMVQWAMEKHAGYKQQDKAAGTTVAKGRSAIFPFII